MEIKSVQKYLISSPRKLREVASLVRELTPSDAVERLPYLNKRASGPLRKVINTAIANAKQKGVSESDLVFKEIQINEGPRLKRFRAGARGRAKPYKRRMSHIRVVLTTKSQAPSTKSKINSKDKNIKSKTKKKRIKRASSRKRSSKTKS